VSSGKWIHLLFGKWNLPGTSAPAELGTHSFDFRVAEQELKHTCLNHFALQNQDAHIKHLGYGQEE
jgi:hypothetical protein